MASLNLDDLSEAISRQAISANDVLNKERFCTLDGEPVVDPLFAKASNRDLDPAGPSRESELSLIAKCLRFGGVVLLLFAALCYLRQGWANAESLWRYHSFLIFTVVLAGSGLLCGLGLRETKGARTLLGVSVSFLPAHFAQLGALLIGALGGGLYGIAYSIPYYLRFVTTLDKAILTIVVASLVLLPLAYAAFSALSRNKARELTMIFAVCNFLLLIPTRQPTLVLLLAAVATGFVVAKDCRVLVKDAGMQTFEGTLCRAMLYSPILVLLLRNIMLYGAGKYLLSFLLALVAAGLFCFTKSITTRPRVITVCEILSLGVAASSWLSALLGFWWPLGHDYVEALYGVGTACAGDFLIFTIPLALLSVMMGYYSKDNREGFFQLGSSLVFIGAMTAQFFASCFLAAVACVVVGAILSARGLYKGAKLSFCGGLICALCGLTYLAINLWTFLNIAPWMALATGGLVIVVFSSVIEQKFNLLVAKAKLVMSRFPS